MKRILGVIVSASLLCGAGLVNAQGTSSPAPAPAAPAAPAGQTAPAAPAAPAGPAPGSVTVTGLVDIYFGVNARAPYPPAILPTTDGQKIKIDNSGRAFDINSDTPTFSLGEISIVRTAGKGFPLGITAVLTAGDTARIVHANEPGGTSSWQTFQQLYLTYTPHVAGRDIPIDFGIFVTPFGQEVIESSSNDEYSRGFLFTYAIPLYHMGLRATIPLTPALSFVGGIVNGWNDIADDNNGKSLFGQLAWTVTPKLTVTAGFMGGPEGTGAYGVIVPHNVGDIDTNLGEILATYNPTSKLKLGLEGDLASAYGSIYSQHVSGNWDGFAGYARYQFTNHFAVAARAEQFEDMPGAGSLLGPGGAGGLRLANGYTKLQSATLTLEYTSFRSRLVSRLEYRHDGANNDFFDTARGGHGPNQDTIELGEVYKF